MPWLKVEPVIDLGMKGICKRPYPNHPKGCPNWDKKEGCPPGTPTIDKVLDFKKSVYVIYNIYDFGAHCKRMRNKHPEWSQRQVECCLYWQQTARKQLDSEIRRFKDMIGNLRVVLCPEALGVNLTGTMESVGIQLEWPPVTKAYQIAIAGVDLNPTIKKKRTLYRKIRDSKTGKLKMVEV